MMLSNAPNVLNAPHHSASQEERDLLNRSTKKTKWKITHFMFNNENQQTDNPPAGVRAEAIPDTTKVNQGTISFRDMVAAQHVSHQPSELEEEEDFSDDDELPEEMVEDPRCPAILLTKEEKQRMRRPWKHALIIKMFDAKIGYMSLMKRLKKKWELNGVLVLTDIGHEYFIARFSNIGDYNHVLTQGPWLLDDNYLTIRKWIPTFIPDDSPMRFITAWVRIPHLSVEYFDKEFLQKVGGKIGKVARIDNNTALAQRGQFTRLSVELDLSKPLLSKFWLKGRIWKVQYEGLRLICFKCGKIGHQGDNCTNDIVNLEKEVENMEISTNQVVENLTPQSLVDQTYGSWMLVKKPPPRKRPPRPEKQQTENAKGSQPPKVNTARNGPRIGQPEARGGSRFSILGEENPAGEGNQSEDPANQAALGVDVELSHMETVDLGKSSQISNILANTNPFNIGKSNINTTNCGQFLGDQNSGRK